ncbi:hypothetical protein DL95DRAFT_450718 [Leptodontidium sp. 2 PMI_412]|nr:hypothetical protein DL95DRAFT_450718 [Leptodontidium sp. 2 PMI_412]
MSVAGNLKFLFAISLAGYVAADAGDDFSNNLFSDLAPLLALFGERVTMQFMSQSMGWADNIILAMAPLGIITIIVGAIRVGGPSWLKAIIGRARQSRAIAEFELMSSTSNEVCELWNGQEVVRVMGVGPIREFIILLPEGSGENGEQAKTKATTQTQTSSTSETGSDFVAELSTVELTLKAPESDYLKIHSQKFREDSNSEKVKARTSESGKGLEGASVIVVRNTVAQAPNLTLNAYNQFGRGELYVVAVCGIVIQFGVLIYSGFATYYPTLMFLKAGKPVADYAFPCTATGILLLVTGMLICSHVIENSSGDRGLTDKIRCALLSILGAEDVQEVVAVTGTIVSICGFIVQFIGLRGMHWSASIAQLGAITIMTTLRTWVRRNLVALPKSQPLLSGHEMDWLAMTLGGDRTKAPWLYPSKVDGRRRSRPWAEDGGWDWRMTAVGDPAKCDKLKPQADTAGRNTHGSKEPLQANKNGDHGMRQTADSVIQGKGSDSRSNAHKVMKIRRDLGKLADWHGPASAEAISLVRAIEVSMDALFGSLTGKFTWSLEVCGEPIHFRLEREQTGGWKAYSDEIEAALSLWLYFVHDREQGPEVDNEVDKELQVDDDRKQVEDGKENEETLRHKGTTIDDDAWLRAKGTAAKRSLRLLSLYTPDLHRDLRWWMPDGVGRVIEVKECESTCDGSAIEVETHRIVGYISNSSSDPPTKTRTRMYKAQKPSESPNEDPPDHQADDREMASMIIAAESYTPLKTLFAQYMFSAFMWAVAKTMEEPIAGGADIRPTERDGMSGDSTWQSTGLGSLEEIYLSVIPPLSLEQKLPQADAIIELARQYAKRHEQLGHWKEAGDAYLWLFRTAKTFPESIATKATAVLIEYLRTVTLAIELKEAQKYEKGDIQGLKELKSSLEEELKTVGQWILSSLMRLYEEQGRPWECTLVQEAGSAGEQDTSYPETFKSTKLHRLAQSPGWSAAM